MVNERAASVIFAGAGPGGLGPLVCAAQQGRLEALLDRGIVILDRAPAIGCGAIGRYALNADSAGTSFLECTDHATLRRALKLERLPRATRELERHRDGHPPLELVAAHLRAIGEALERVVRSHPRSTFLPRTTVEGLCLHPDETVTVRSRSAAGKARAFHARNVVLALGGQQRWDRILDSSIPGGIRLADLDRSKIVRADTLLTQRGLAAAERRLREIASPRIVILGGSHSAFSVAWALLERTSGVEWGPGVLSILHRAAPRVFYPCAEDAIADGYGFDDRDVCPKTKRIHRLGGLRGDGRALWRRVTGRSGTLPEPRLCLETIRDASRLRRLLDRADLVVPAFGYRPVTVPVFERDGTRIALAADRDGPHVGADCRVRRADGGKLARVFGIGMASGFLPSGALGGEPSFRGQTNGVWLYQNGIGARVLDGIEPARAKAS